MNIDLLIKMANEIGDFFAGTTDADAAARDVANHLTRYWEPRMRAQMLKYYEERGGAGLSDIAKAAVALLYAASRGATAATPPGATPPGATPPGAAPTAAAPTTAAPTKGAPTKGAGA
jgi:formate dehydrogenase subunit delta